jgi:hypothetical protein
MIVKSCFVKARILIKKGLVADAEESAAKMVFRIQLAGLADASDHFHGRDVRCPACTKEFGGLVFPQGVLPVVLAYRAVLPAGLPVFRGVFYNRTGRIKHVRRGWR